MLNDQRPQTGEEVDTAAADETEFRDIHELPPSSEPSSSRGRRRESWEASSHRWSTLSVGSDVPSEHLSTMSREFNAMVVAGSTMQNDSNASNGNHDGLNLARIGEEELEETNPLAIVPDNNPIPSPTHAPPADSPAPVEELSVQQVKKEEVESKISAWQTSEIAKISNRLKREDMIINGWESEQIEKATAWLKKVERKLDEKRAKAIEKMQNDLARAHRKAEEKRASSEAKRGTKVAKVLDLANLMRAVGRAPSKRSLF
ncbi:remorin 4.1-like [Phoenix dactylifera]|uniref:Remorin 4.1-like n=1 Tax=Phoenix dactylifera TaxID=42345 RepID=A0A8B8ZJU9_PHODC|nr:remorin 4.1-like [Phoenix dactylifera]XP_038971743.1 remorin 4.1-like [Phoenix dactylifera]